MPEHIVLAFADDNEEHLSHQDFELQEIRDKALKDARQGKYVELTEHSGSTYNSLSDFLNSKKGENVSMFHYSGHSSKDGLRVQWKDGNGIIKSEPLTNLFKAHKKFRFVFLNSCCSEETAILLADAGVPYVIGTSSDIEDRQAAIIAGKFYDILGSKGKTIQEAFGLTEAFFKSASYNDDGKIKEAFRGLKHSLKQTSENPWQLYQSPFITDEDKKWSLIPESNLKLSKKSNKNYNLRVFCFYEGESAELYKLISLYFEEKGLLFNGLDEISPASQPKTKDVISECEAADIIIHILSNKYLELWNKENNTLTNLCQQKINIAIAWGNEFKTPYKQLVNKGISFRNTFPRPYLNFESIQNLKNNNNTLSDIFFNVVATELEKFFKQFSKLRGFGESLAFF